MAFRIKRGDSSVRKAVQRIAREQIDKALDEIANEDLDRHETVHQVRKRCKKIRGLLRVVRPQFEKTWRDIARSRSGIRDATSIIETFDALMTHFSDTAEMESFMPARAELLERRARATGEQIDLPGRLDAAAERMREGRERVSAWRLHDSGFDAVEDGLEKTYSRGRSAMKDAYQHPDIEHFHEWRKRVKYHWYHIRIMRNIWKTPMKARQDELKDLSDYLGDDHDLAILRETVTQAPDAFGGGETVDALCALIVQRQSELRQRARRLGARVYAEKPARLPANRVSSHRCSRLCPCASRSLPLLASSCSLFAVPCPLPPSPARRSTRSWSSAAMRSGSPSALSSSAVTGFPKRTVMRGNRRGNRQGGGIASKVPST